MGKRMGGAGFDGHRVQTVAITGPWEAITRSQVASPSVLGKTRKTGTALVRFSESDISLI